MIYKPASTQIGKLSKAELENAKQVNDISLKKFITDTMEKRVIQTQPRNTTLPLSMQWASEWIPVTENNTDKLWVSWSLPMGQFNQNWLSRFSIEIVVRNVGGLYRIETGSSFAKFIGWDIKDVEGRESSNIKDIKLLASVYSTLTDTPLFDAKLLVKYIAQACHD